MLGDLEVREHLPLVSPDYEIIIDTVVWSLSRLEILSMMEDMILATDISRNKCFMSQFEVSAHI